MVATPVVVVAPEQYYTDGKRLFYIIELNRSGRTALVENCGTLVERIINIETIFSSWSPVILNG